MDGQSVEIAAASFPETAVAPNLSRPLPWLGHVLCQVCHRPTNSEVQNDMVDSAFVFQFNGIPRAVLCWECYMNGTIMGAMLALQAPAKEQCGHGEPADECCRRGESDLPL